MISLKRSVAGVLALLLALSIVLVAPADAGQGKAKGHQRGDTNTTVVRDPSPGVPTSPRGRGR